MRKSLLACLLWLAIASGIAAAESVRLALVPGDPAVAPALDVLTVELSKPAGVELLERAQVDKVYREQATAAGGSDFLKLGQVLGADGLLVLELARAGEQQVLSARLVAVKPGVVLRQRNYPWPLEDVTGWGVIVSGQFLPLLPKLAVLPKDAVPISVLNLRSAARSPESETLERELTLLVQNRLTQEKEIFVLERRRLGSLAEEKDLKPEVESPFWNGSYLLEGSIDRQGFAQSLAAVNARLVPPDGGSPTEFEISGPRTNRVAVAEALARKILEVLRRTSSAPEWKPADEAARYLDEAKWALKWKMYVEAQAAADSAWALGRHDMDCALIRVKSYTASVPPDTGGYQRSEYRNSTGRPEVTSTFVRNLLARHPRGLAYVQRGTATFHTQVGKMPEPAAIDRAIFDLSLYHDFSRTLPAEEPKASSPWYQLGVEALEAASRVLEHFHFVPDSQPPVADKLAELRALARTVATWLSQSPSVRATYWVGDQSAAPEEFRQLADTMNIFRCKVDWGCFWQDRPEDGVALYRELMSSAAFAHLNNRLWFRPLQRPRLASWNATDGQRLPEVWRHYLDEVGGSSNVILRLEGRFLELADAVSAKENEPVFDDLFALIFSHRDQIVSNPVAVLDREWHLGELIYNLDDSVTTPEEERISRRFYSEHRPKLQAMREEHANRFRQVTTQRGLADRFEMQRRFLEELTPFDSATFSRTFNGAPWSKSQAAELLPLLAAYRSNLVARSGVEKSAAQPALTRLRFLEERLNRVLNHPVFAATTNALRPATPPTTPAPRNIPPPTIQESPNPFVAATNVLTVSRYVKLPLERLTNGRPAEVRMSGFFIFAHRWREGRLWLDCRFEYYSPNRGHLGHHAAFMVWTPPDATWEIIPCHNPEKIPARPPVGFMGEPETRLHFEVFNGALYLSDWDEMRRFDLKMRRWEALKFPGQQLAQLFAVNERLYAANGESIYEIIDGGQSTRVLASCRRRPAASALDSLERLGWVTVFPGPGQTLRATVGGAVFEWDGRDWREMMSLPAGKTQSFDEATLLRSLPHRGTAEVRRIPHAGQTSELCWTEEVREFIPAPAFRPRLGPPGGKVQSAPLTTWAPLPGAFFAAAPAAVRGSNLFFLVEHSGVTNLPAGPALAEKDGRHANLVCLDRGSPAPFAIPLRFDLSRGSWTSWQTQVRKGPFVAGPVSWLVSTPDQLLIGQAGTPGIWIVPHDEIAAAIRSR